MRGSKQAVLALLELVTVGGALFILPCALLDLLLGPDFASTLIEATLIEATLIASTGIGLLTFIGIEGDER